MHVLTDFKNQNRLQKTQNMLEPLSPAGSFVDHGDKQVNQLEYKSYFNDRSYRASELQVAPKHASQTRDMREFNISANHRDPAYMSNSFVLEPSPTKIGKRARNRVHRNSIEKVEVSVERPPEMPAQNAKQTHLNQMAGYLNRLDSRLSQPKLHSAVRMSLKGSTASLGNKGSPPGSPLKATTVKRRNDGSGFKGSVGRQDSTEMKIKEFRNNSMSELYNSCQQSIQKPTHNLRNSVNMKGMASSPVKNILPEQRQFHTMKRDSSISYL